MTPLQTDIRELRFKLRKRYDEISKEFYDIIKKIDDSLEILEDKEAKEDEKKI